MQTVYEQLIERGKSLGLAEGKSLGKASLLLRQLGLRFGSVPDAFVSRLETATPEQLDQWAERILVASCLDEILSP